MLSCIIFDWTQWIRIGSETSPAGRRVVQA